MCLNRSFRQCFVKFVVVNSGYTTKSDATDVAPTNSYSWGISPNAITLERASWSPSRCIPMLLRLFYSTCVPIAHPHSHATAEHKKIFAAIQENHEGNK